MREREFFLELIHKVKIEERYSSMDRVWLNMIRREHSNSDKLIP
jgi:hypothetical protein